MDTIKLIDLCPFWAESDPRLKHFNQQDHENLTVLDALQMYDSKDSPILRMLVLIFLDSLKLWKEYNHYKSQINTEDQAEFAKFDLEFRRYITRRDQISYEDDFEDVTVKHAETLPAESQSTHGWNSTFDAGDDICVDTPSLVSTNTFSVAERLELSLATPRPPTRMPTFPSINGQVLENYIYEEDSIEFDKKNVSTDGEIAENIMAHPDEYKILKFLGKGGEGKVFLAVSTIDSSQVALKQYEVPQCEEKDLRALLGREITMIKKLSHQNVVKCYGLHIPQQEYEDSFVCNIVMEYISGGCLASMIRKQGAFEIETTKQITRDVLQGLAYLHANNIIHRDLKPANVLAGEVYKITDFGISTQVCELESVARSCVGTPWYMAPEVIMQEPYSFSADIWSLGCLVFELVTGKRPFCTAGMTKVLHLMVDCESPLANTNFELDGTVLDFLQKCWRRPHTLRLSARELLKHPFLEKS